MAKLSLVFTLLFFTVIAPMEVSAGGLTLGRGTKASLLTLASTDLTDDSPLLLSKNLELSSAQIDEVSAACTGDTCTVPNLDPALERSASEVQALDVLSGEEPKAPRQSLMDKLLGGSRPAAPQAEVPTLERRSLFESLLEKKEEVEDSARAVVEDEHSSGTESATVLGSLLPGKRVANILSGRRNARQASPAVNLLKKQGSHDEL